MGKRQLILDGDGRPVKGFDVIYPPGSQAFEYAALATNPYIGCGHKCLYCYVPAATHQARPAFDVGAELKPDFFDRLIPDAERYQAAGVTDQVFITFRSDPYHLGDTAPTRRTIEVLQQHGLGVSILTKGGMRSMQDIDVLRHDRDCFAITLTSIDAAFAAKWEPAAAAPHDRIEALLRYKRAGIFTWLSLEPTLSIEHSLQVVDRTYEFTDYYKVGKANYLGKITRDTDWQTYTLRMIEKLQALGVRHYIKKDLQRYLPAGYHNPLRIQQHN
jgi:DNA repair photolyase